MKRLVIYFFLWWCFSGSAFSQSARSGEMHGSQGLAVTEEILTELDLPDWCWAGAHIYEEVERNFRLVDGELLDTYFGKLPASGLNDPQHILDDEQRQVIEELIAAHDMKSALPLYVNVLAHGQKMALSEDDVKSKLSGMFKEKNAMVIFYYYGYSRGVNGYVMLDEQGFIEGWEVDELFLKSARDASLQVGGDAQMESFVREFSKRSFWLEQKLITPVRAEKNLPTNEHGKSNSSGSWDDFMETVRSHSLTLVLAFWALAAGAWYFLWSRKWRKFILPQGEVPTRLGADNGANVSHTIEFSDATVSLTDQYEKAQSREL